MNTEKKTRKWRWLCETYIQWYALAFLLSALCVRLENAEVERAWNAVDTTLQLGLKLSSVAYKRTKMNPIGVSDVNETSCDAYKPLRKLIEKARAARFRTSPPNDQAGVMNIATQDGLGTAIGGVEGNNLLTENFTDAALLDGLSASEISVPQEIPDLYYPWIYNFEFPNQGYNTTSGSID